MRRRRKLAYAAPSGAAPSQIHVDPTNRSGLAVAPSGRFTARPVVADTTKKTLVELARDNEKLELERADIEASWDQDSRMSAIDHEYEDPHARERLRQEFRAQGVHYDDPAAVREGFDWEDLHGYED